MQVLKPKGHRGLWAPGKPCWQPRDTGTGRAGVSRIQVGLMGKQLRGQVTRLSAPHGPGLQPVRGLRDELTNKPGAEPQDTEGHLLASHPPTLCSAGQGWRAELPEPLTPDLGAGWFSWDDTSSIAAQTYRLTLWRWPQNCHSTNHGGQGVTGAEANTRVWDGHLWFHVRENPDLQAQVLFQFSHSHSSLTSGWGKNKPSLICRLNSLKSQLVLFLIYFFSFCLGWTPGAQNGNVVPWSDGSKCQKLL